MPEEPWTGEWFFLIVVMKWFPFTTFWVVSEIDFLQRKLTTKTFHRLLLAYIVTVTDFSKRDLPFYKKSFWAILKISNFHFLSFRKFAYRLLHFSGNFYFPKFRQDIIWNICRHMLGEKCQTTPIRALYGQTQDARKTPYSGLNLGSDSSFSVLIVMILWGGVNISEKYRLKRLFSKKERFKPN